MKIQIINPLAVDAVLAADAARVRHAEAWARPRDAESTYHGAPEAARAAWDAAEDRLRAALASAEADALAIPLVAPAVPESLPPAWKRPAAALARAVEWRAWMASRAAPLPRRLEWDISRGGNDARAWVHVGVRSTHMDPHPAEGAPRPRLVEYDDATADERWLDERRLAEERDLRAAEDAPMEAVRAALGLPEPDEVEVEGVESPQEYDDGRLYSYPQTLSWMRWDFELESA